MIYFEKVLVVKFFFRGEAQLDEIEFDSWRDYEEWLEFMGAAVEIMSEGYEYKLDR